MIETPRTKLDWLMRFRRAKTQDTLDFMLDRALDQLSSTTEKAEAILAHAARQDELDSRHWSY
ncbi:HHA domain-containing protein [Celerinatantimonas yamalensis]|uniref:Hemolysin expression modulating protein n=1 Tax=Celerinatantimonas yamalensis TaxID=559956 RepID=A0ABW9G8A4_9GAMM